MTLISHAGPAPALPARTGTSRATWWPTVSTFVSRAAGAVRAAIERGRQRRVLAGLDDRLLRDIGVTRAEAERECAKPFWRP